MLIDECLKRIQLSINLKTRPPHDEFAELLEYIGGTVADFPYAKAKWLDISLPEDDKCKVKLQIDTGAGFVKRGDNEWL